MGESHRQTARAQGTRDAPAGRDVEDIPPRLSATADEPGEEADPCARPWPRRGTQEAPRFERVPEGEAPVKPGRPP